VAVSRPSLTSLSPLDPFLRKPALWAGLERRQTIPGFASRPTALNRSTPGLPTRLLANGLTVRMIAVWLIAPNRFGAQPLVVGSHLNTYIA
jgi:hypothetical protein